MPLTHNSKTSYNTESDVLLSSTSEEKSPSTQPPHSTFPDNDGDCNDHDSLPSRNENEEGNLDKNSTGRENGHPPNNVDLPTEKSDDKSSTCSALSRSAQESTYPVELQHCSVGSTVPTSSKITHDIGQPILSSSHVDQSTSNVFPNESQG